MSSEHGRAREAEEAKRRARSHEEESKGRGKAGERIMYLVHRCRLRNTCRTIGTESRREWPVFQYSVLRKW